MIGIIVGKETMRMIGSEKGYKKGNGEKREKKGNGKREWEKGGYGRTRKQCILCMAFLLFAVTFMSCSSKEAVLLEEEDLVRTSDGARAWTEDTWDNSQEAMSSDGRLAPGGMQPAEGGSQPGAADWEAEPIQGAAGDVSGNWENAETAALFVHICGEVKAPGVYELPAGSRIFEAVEAAGGFTQAACQSYVNLALELKDGWKVEIPALGEEPGNGGGAGTDSPKAADAASAAMQGITESTAGVTGQKGNSTVETAGTGAQSAALVNVNTATKEELCTLPGVGASRAESIISYREKNGGFGKIEDIMKVEGIKEGMFSKMKDKICVRGVE